MKIKKMISMVMAACMLLTLAFPAGAVSTGEQTSIPEGYTPVYAIEDLYAIRNYPAANYILMNDIDISETAPGGDWDDGRGWTPIGPEFTGVFDGNGYKIIGMNINVTSLPAGAPTDYYTGLFAKNSGTIKNLAMVGGSASIGLTDKNVYYGTIAGRNGGTIENCSNESDFSCVIGSGSNFSGYTGGITGYNAGTVIESNNKGDLTVTAKAANRGSSSKAYFGGITGYSTGVIESSFNMGNLASGVYSSYSDDHYYSSSNSYYGGIAGYTGGSSQINNVYNCGEIQCVRDAADGNAGGVGINGGGIVGLFTGNSSLTNAYNLKDLTYTASGTKYIGSIIGYREGTNTTITNCYYKNTMAAGVGSGTDPCMPKSDAMLKFQGVYQGFDFQNTWFKSSDPYYPYPQLTENATCPTGPAAPTLAADPVTPTNGNVTVTITYPADAAMKEYKIGSGEWSAYTQPVVLTTNGKIYARGADAQGNYGGTGMIAISNIGAGLPEGYTPVYTIEDLYAIRNYPAANYILMNDIDISETAPGGDWDDGRGWTPIGPKFTGVFDGNGFSVIGMNINVTSLPAGAPTDYYTGLFAKNSGTIKNLAMVGGSVYINLMYMNVYYGTIAGYNSGRIENCSSSTAISVTAKAANRGSSSKAYFGGIAGYSTGVIESSFNMGNLASGVYSSYSDVHYYSSSNSYYGGIAGYTGGSSQINNVYNCGEIQCVRDATDGNAGGVGINGGGIVGRYTGNSSLMNAYNLSALTYTGGSSNKYLGSVIGYREGTATTIANCYYKNTMAAGVGSGTDPCMPKSDAMLKFQGVYQGFDFQNTWFKSSDPYYPYPQLTENATCPTGPAAPTLAADPVTPTNGNVTVTITYPADAAMKEYKIGSGEWSAYTQPVVLTTNGKIYARGADAQGNYGGTGMIAISNIGAGLPEGYTPVYTIEDLYAIRNYPAANYILMNDIDISETAPGGDWDDGRGWTPIGPKFTGVFDGNGFSVIGMNINVTSLPAGAPTDYYTGLFAKNSGTIKNLAMVGGSVYINLMYMNVYYGTIAGYNSGRIENCSSSTAISVTAKAANRGSSSKAYFGGIAGYSTGVIESSFNMGNLASGVYSSYSDVHYYSSSNSYYGGIAGYTGGSSQINNVYNCGEIQCVRDAADGNAGGVGINGGGIVGRYTGNSSLTNAYNLKDLTYTASGTKYIGSIIGYREGTNTTITNCYYKNTMAAGVGSGTDPCMPKSDAMLKFPVIYQGFDFQNTWFKSSDPYYPYPQLIANPLIPVMVIQEGSSTVVDEANGFIYGIDGNVQLTPATGLSFGTGSLVKLAYPDGSYKTFTVVIFGDVNGDGLINAIDADICTLVQNWMIEWDETEDAALIKAADVNGDGRVDSVDADIISLHENWLVTIDQTTGLVS